MGGLWRDLAFGFRGLLRKPGFSLPALASLMLGIGVNTAIFTLLDSVFLRPLPLEDLDRLVAVFRTIRADNGEYGGEHALSYGNYADYLERNRTLEELALYQWEKLVLTNRSDPQKVFGMYVTDNYFELLGLEAERGRLFRPEDGREASDPVAVVSHGAWERLFGADPEIVGRQLTLNGESLTVVGVAPRGFRGTIVTVSADVFVPLPMFKRLSSFRTWFDNRGASIFMGLGRLREGVTVEQANREVFALARQLEGEYPKMLEGLGAKVLPLVDSAIALSDRGRFADYAKRSSIVLVILLIGCLSVANLLFVRGVERGRELAVRQAMGAGRGRLLRQLLTENLLLFLLGGLGSLLVARLFLKLLWTLRPPDVAAAALEPALDAVVWGFALLVALLVGLLFGLLPALRAARSDLVSNLKENEPLGSSRRWPAVFKPRSIVVALQVALALVGLIGAGLLMRNLEKVFEIDLGFDSERLAVMSVSPGEQGYEEPQVRDYYRRLLERARALPGVTAASWSQNRLLRGAIVRRQIFLPGDDTSQQMGAMLNHRVNIVGPGFFDTVGIRLLEGRDFRDSEPDGQLVAIVNETMAKTLWPDLEPIGQRFTFDYPTPPYLEVVGVVADAKYRQIREDRQFFVYIPLAQHFAAAMTLHVRTDRDPATLVETLHGEARELDPNLVLSDVATMGSFVREALWLERASTALLGLFGALALGLALVGIYGLLAYSVNRRGREIGIQMALGARRGDVLRSVLLESLQVAAAGVVVGLIASALVLRPVMANQLHGVSVLDPATYALWSAVLLIAALLGSFVPAWRAARTNPTQALRAE